jgi:hypothetical protein
MAPARNPRMIERARANRVDAHPGLDLLFEILNGKCRGTGSRDGSITFRANNLVLESVRSSVLEMHRGLGNDPGARAAGRGLRALQPSDRIPISSCRHPEPEFNKTTTKLTDAASIHDNIVAVNRDLSDLAASR